MSGYSPKPSSPNLDTTIPASERYRIIGRIASGGMAEIYLARMLTAAGVEREVVLKRLMPELQTDHEFVQMFYDEARIASQMRHPNIVQIYELGELDGSLFISMELLRGANLRDLLARLHNRNEKFPIPLAVRVACGALEALAYAHRFTDANGRLLNVVHRDVSPQNIIVTYEGTVKLVDFGVAKAEGRLHQTRAGLIKGKFAYMSPEQVSGAKVDGRSDTFALAEVFYELLLRRHPFFAASDMEVLRAILDVDPPHPSAIDQDFPSELGTIFIRAMRKSPADRYPNATAMHNALEEFLQAQRTPSTTMMLGRFIRDLFADRVETEQRAREAGDDALLIEAMTSGKNEQPRAPEPRRRSQAKSSGPSQPGNGRLLSSGNSGRRDQVVEITRPPPATSADESGERGGPAFLARSGYTDPEIRRKRIKSQVRQLFDDGAIAPTTSPKTDGEDTDLELPPHPGGVDEGELPTMLGTFTADQLDEIRGGKPPLRRDHDPPTNLKVERSSGGRTRESDGGGLPSGRGTDSDDGRRKAALALGPGPKRSGQPTPATGVPQSRATAPSKAQAVTPRSRTVLQYDAEGRISRSDRWGLLLFVAGLGALVGAIVYAVVLYAGAQNPIMRLVVSSTPPGATIIFDGTDTGAHTPTMFPNIPSNKEHTLELRLTGYEPHIQRLPPSSEPGELIVDLRLKPSPRAP